MAYYNFQTVDVNVFNNASPQNTQSFSNVLMLVPHNLSTSTIDTITSVDQVKSIGAATNSPLYQMAFGLFSGGIAAPDYANIGRIVPDTYELTVNSIPEVGEDLSIYAKVNGVETTVSYTIEQGDTTTLAAEGLLAALDLAFPAATAGNPTFASLANVISVTPDTFKSDFGWQSDTDNLPHVAVSYTTSESISTAAENAYNTDDNVSFLISALHDETSIKALASWAETKEIQYGFSTSIADVADTNVTNDLVSDLVALNYTKTFGWYSVYADYYFNEAFNLGSTAGLNPWDLYNESGWTFTGLPVDVLTPTQQNALASKNCNFYISERGYGQYKDGWAISGDYNDVIRFIIWSKYAITTALFELKRRKAKRGSAIPYSDRGAGMMTSAVTSQYITVGVNGGRIATGTTVSSDGDTNIDLNPIVDFSTRADQTNADISNRIWRNGRVEVVFISGINYITLNAYVNLNRDPSA